MPLDPDQVVTQPNPYAIYIAAPFQLRTVAQALQMRLEAEGFVVTSSWLQGDVMPDEQAATVIDHLGDIDRADGLVLLNPQEWADAGTGGRHFETGYAYNAGKAVFVVGARTQVFHYHAQHVQHVSDPELLVPTLKMRVLMINTLRPGAFAPVRGVELAQVRGHITTITEPR